MPKSSSGAGPSKRVVVTLNDASLDSPAAWKQAVAALKAGGLTVAKEMKDIGIVSGSAPESAIDSLKRSSHVVAVEDDERRHAS